KGTIAQGSDADMVLFDPSRSGVVDERRLHSRAGYDPFHGFALRGLPVMTLSRGEVIARDGQLLSEAGRGRHLLRERSKTSEWCPERQGGASGEEWWRGDEMQRRGGRGGVGGGDARARRGAASAGGVRAGEGDDQVSGARGQDTQGRTRPDAAADHVPGSEQPEQDRRPGSGHGGGGHEVPRAQV